MPPNDSAPLFHATALGTLSGPTCTLLVWSPHRTPVHRPPLLDCHLTLEPCPYDQHSQSYIHVTSKAQSGVPDRPLRGADTSDETTIPIAFVAIAN